MKTLTQVWELIQLLSSLHFLSPTLVRASSPQTYTSYCSYNERVWNRNLFWYNHLEQCGDLDCEYYKRINIILLGERAGLGTSAVSANFMGEAAIGVIESAPATGGASVVIGLGLVAVTGVWWLGTSFAVKVAAVHALEGIENELKLVREIEQAEQELNDLQNEFTDLENELEEERENHIEGVRACDRWYQRIIEKKEQRIKSLKQELCRVSSCNRHPNCVHGENNQ